jgi:hypothetical protein
MGAIGIAKFLGKGAFKKEPDSLIGWQLSSKANWAAGLGGIGIGAALGGIEATLGGIEAYKYNTMGVGAKYQARTMGSVAYSGNNPALLYDGRANINKMTGQYDLGADGDIVLAMSANRRG